MQRHANKINKRKEHSRIDGNRNTNLEQSIKVKQTNIETYESKIECQTTNEAIIKKLLSNRK